MKSTRPILIDVVDVISAGEQVAIASTRVGFYLCYAIPDARYDTISDVPHEGPYDYYDDALAAFKRAYL
jgi:hypothetical protein